MKRYNICDALFEPIIDKFYEDPTLIVYGEDNRDWGGAFGVYKKTDRSGPLLHGSSTAPISEAAIVGYRRRLRDVRRTCDRRADVRRLHRLRGR